MLKRIQLIDMGKIKLARYVCEKYEHEWIPRETTAEESNVCPKCKNQYWNVPRKKERK
jgi:hypothetical protein